MTEKDLVRLDSTEKYAEARDVDQDCSLDRGRRVVKEGGDLRLDDPMELLLTFLVGSLVEDKMKISSRFSRDE